MNHHRKRLKGFNIQLAEAMSKFCIYFINFPNERDSLPLIDFRYFCVEEEEKEIKMPVQESNWNNFFLVDLQKDC